MKTLSRKTDSPKDSLAEMKHDLLETQEKLTSAMGNHSRKAKEASTLAESWLARFYTARKALMVTDKELAVEALTILAEQAKQYALAYAKVEEDEKSRTKALQEQNDKIEEMVTRLRLVERSKALSSQLRKISSNTDMPVVESAYQELNTRDVSLMIHTASALIELNTGNDS
jgi:hypothetical protein